MKITISLILLFILIWITFIISKIKIGLNSRSIKKVIKKHYPQIRYEWGFTIYGKSTYRISRAKKEYLKMFLAFGSKRSVMSYFRVFMDLDAIYKTKSFMLVPQIERMIKIQQTTVIAFWSLIVLALFMWVFLV